MVLRRDISIDAQLDAQTTCRYTIEIASRDLRAHSRMSGLTTTERQALEEALTEFAGRARAILTGLPDSSTPVDMPATPPPVAPSTSTSEPTPAHQGPQMPHEMFYLHPNGILVLSGTENRELSQPAPTALPAETATITHAG